MGTGFLLRSSCTSANDRRLTAGAFSWLSQASTVLSASHRLSTSPALSPVDFELQPIEMNDWQATSTSDPACSDAAVSVGVATSEGKARGDRDVATAADALGSLVLAELFTT